MNPNWKQIVREHIAVLRLPPEREIEIVEELALHLEAAYEDARADGFSEAEAEARAVQGYDWRLLECELSLAEQPLASRALQPSLELIERKGGMRMESLLQDLRYGTRTLLKTPALTFAAIITLAIGIGATSTIFSVVDAILLRSLPYRQPERLVMIWGANLQKGWDQENISPSDFLDWRDQNKVFESMVAFGAQEFNFTGRGEPEMIHGHRVSAGLFRLLGVNAHLGRTFLPEEEKYGGERAVVLRHSLWERRFGSDPKIIGQTITLHGEPYTVIGVMPKDFEFFNRQTELWTSLPFDLAQIKNRGTRFLRVMARLKEGVSLEQAQAEIKTIAARLEGEYPDTNKGWSVNIVPLNEWQVGNVRRALLVSLGAAGFTLLISCANIANLLLTRAVSRKRELVIRAALGASRGRLVRQLLTESLILAVSGGLFGLLLAFFGVRLLVDLVPDVSGFGQWLLQIDRIQIAGRVLSFTLFISIACAALFGLIPALRAGKEDITSTLNESSATSSADSLTRRALSMIVGLEIASGLVLVVCAGLLITSFGRLKKVDPGFLPDDVTTMSAFLPQTRYPTPKEIRIFHQDFIRWIKTVPGVESAALTSILPLSKFFVSTDFLIEGRPLASSGQMPRAIGRVITEDYFQTMRIPLLKGRFFTEQDSENASRVVLINETAAHLYWPNEDPVGQRIIINDQTGRRSLEIIGVVGAVRNIGFASNSMAEIYVPMLQNPIPLMSMVVRSPAGLSDLTTLIRSEVRKRDPDLPVYRVRTMQDIVQDSVWQARLSTALLGALTMIAIVLAVVGIYGVTAYAGAQRKHEIGIRLALGASPTDILKLMARDLLKLAIGGVLAGIILSLFLTRILSSLLYDVSALDPMTFMTASLLFTSVTLIAGLVPTWKATKVSPLQTLRHD